MIVYRKLFCRCLMILSVTCAFCVCIEPTRNELMRYLLEEAEYDHNFPPSTENATDVSVQLYITDFNSESDKDREIEFTLNLRINWTDPRLDFTRNGTTYDVIKFGDDIVDSLWMPDLYFLNERKSQLHGLFERNQLAYIYKNGSVFYSGRFNIKLHCVMTFDKYPFDTQRCPIEIQSYAYSTDYVLLHWNGDHAIQIDPASDPIRPKIPSQGQSIEIRNTYPITGEFSTLRTEIEIPRPEGSYDMMITWPSIILVITALTSFLLGDNITPRIGVPTGTLISLFVQWSGTYTKLSLDSSSKCLDTWMCVHLAFLGTILVVNACICHCKYKVDKDKKDRTCVRWYKRSAIDTQKPSSKKCHGAKENLNFDERKKLEEQRLDDFELSELSEEFGREFSKKFVNSSTEGHSSDDGKEAERPSSFINKMYEKDPLSIQNPNYGSTDMDQPGPSSNGESQPKDETNDTIEDPTKEEDMNQAEESDDGRPIKYKEFQIAKKNLNSDERYKSAKEKFGEKELEELYSEFVREKTENDFYNLLEEKKSSISVQESKKDCCECCKSCCSKCYAGIQVCFEKLLQTIKDCIVKPCQEINIMLCIVISLAYLIFLIRYRLKWVST